jgi:hypothetical protein
MCAPYIVGLAFAYDEDDIVAGAMRRIFAHE